MYHFAIQTVKKLFYSSLARLANGAVLSFWTAPFFLPDKNTAYLIPSKKNGAHCFRKPAASGSLVPLIQR